MLDPALRERAHLSDLVARVRIQTVTVERRSNGDPVYRLGLQVASPRLVDKMKADDNIEVLIVPGGASHGLARAWDVRLQGRSFVGFFRRFAGNEGETVLHFHLEPDSADVANAVQNTLALKEIKGS